MTEVVWPDGRPPFEVRSTVLEPGTIIEDDDLRVRAFPVTHRGADSFGFVFEEKSRPRMLPDRLAALDVPAGPERRRLLEGEEVVLPDGRRIVPDEVLGPPQPGTRLIVVGDAACADELLEEVRGADALIIEATFLEAAQAQPGPALHCFVALIQPFPHGLPFRQTRQHCLGVSAVNIGTLRPGRLRYCPACNERRCHEQNDGNQN